MTDVACNGLSSVRVMQIAIAVQEDAIANYRQRLAELERVIAGPLSDSGNSLPVEPRPPAPK